MTRSRIAPLLTALAIALAGAGAASAAAASAGPGTATGAEQARGPKPPSAAHAARAERTLESVSAHAARVERALGGIERAAGRWGHWRRCVHGVPVSERGDVDGGVFGYQYDERDGTGVDRRAALALASPSVADYRLLQLSRNCRTRRTQPNGTAEAAAAGASLLAGTRAAVVGAPAATAASDSPAARVAALERRVAQLRQRTRRVERAARRFDGWESCLSQLPVTEFGDPAGAFGYRYGRASASAGADADTRAFRSAIAIDRSDWDDPDYVFLAFRRGDRPGGECDNDPGESSD